MDGRVRPKTNRSNKRLEISPQTSDRTLKRLSGRHSEESLSFCLGVVMMILVFVCDLDTHENSTELWDSVGTVTLRCWQRHPMATHDNDPAVQVAPLLNTKPLFGA